MKRTNKQTFTITKKELDELINHTCDGINTDGGHHKQWHLEQILKILIGEKDFQAYKKEFKWESGIK